LIAINTAVKVIKKEYIPKDSTPIRLDMATIRIIDITGSIIRNAAKIIEFL
jgi:hypothetical protein